jgi:hypothetical protein
VIRDTPADVISVKLGINLVNLDVMRMRAFESAVHGSSIRSATATPKHHSCSSLQSSAASTRTHPAREPLILQARHGSDPVHGDRRGG